MVSGEGQRVALRGIVGVYRAPADRMRWRRGWPAWVDGVWRSWAQRVRSAPRWIEWRSDLIGSRTGPSQLTVTSLRPASMSWMHPGAGGLPRGCGCEEDRAPCDGDERGSFTSVPPAAAVAASATASAVAIASAAFAAARAASTLLADCSSSSRSIASDAKLPIEPWLKGRHSSSSSTGSYTRSSARKAAAGDARAMWHAQSRRDDGARAIFGRTYSGARTQCEGRRNDIRWGWRGVGAPAEWGWRGVGAPAEWGRVGELLTLTHALLEVSIGRFRIRPLVVVVGELHPVIVFEYRGVIADGLEVEQADGRLLASDAVAHAVAPSFGGVGGVKDAARTPTRVTLQPCEELVERIHCHAFTLSFGLLPA